MMLNNGNIPLINMQAAIAAACTCNLGFQVSTDNTSTYKTTNQKSSTVNEIPLKKMHCTWLSPWNLNHHDKLGPTCFHFGWDVKHNGKLVCDINIRNVCVTTVTLQ